MPTLRASRPLILLLCGSLLCVALGACGQKGPLYLPDAAPTEKKDEKKKDEPPRADTRSRR